MTDGLRRFLFQRSLKTRECSHLDRVAVVDSVCPHCDSDSSRWFHLRMCLICGEPGCCDSSRARHARKHFEETGHALIRSVEPREQWGWCYVDKAYLRGSDYLG